MSPFGTNQGGGFLGRRGKVWTFIAGWFVPVVMTIAYITLALTSETNATGWAWMSIGLAFVLTLWFLFRTLTKSAAMARAMAVGDIDLVLEIDKRPLSHAVVHDMRADWMKSLAVLDRIAETGGLKKPRERALLVILRVGALVETGEVAKARLALAALEPELARLHPRIEAASHLTGAVAKGRVLTGERANAEALVVLQKVIDDVRTGQRVRALAHYYAARAAANDGQIELADKHRERAAALAPGSWFTI
ncbi:MAG: hypothetical protein ABI591_09880 [Kofleriaceae bacterium]